MKREDSSLDDISAIVSGNLAISRRNTQLSDLFIFHKVLAMLSVIMVLGRSLGKPAGAFKVVRFCAGILQLIIIPIKSTSIWEVT